MNAKCSYIASYSYIWYRCINTHNTNMYIAMPNRNYTMVCILSPCNKVICSLSFCEHCTIISAPCIAADTCGFLYHNSPIKFCLTYFHAHAECGGIVGDLIFLKGDFLTVG